MMSGLYTRIVAIQPMCAIDEYARIFRSWVWFKPFHPIPNPQLPQHPPSNTHRTPFS